METIVAHPEREGVVRAWDLTLGNLVKIVEICREKQIDLAFVVSPFTFQFADPTALNAPQKTLAAFAVENDLRMLDPIRLRRLDQPIEIRTGSSPPPRVCEELSLPPHDERSDRILHKVCIQWNSTVLEHTN